MTITRALHFSLVLAAFGVLAAPPNLAQAQVEETTLSARAVALGTGVRASAASTSALAQNPANLSLTRVYHLEGTTTYEPGVGRFAFGTAIVDSSSSRLGAGLSFRGLVGGDDTAYGGLDFRGGLSLPVSDALGIGVSVRYVSLPGVMPDGTQVNYAKGLTMDAALRATLIPNLHVAVLGSNLIDRHSALVPVRVGGSASYTIADTLTLGLDAMFNLSQNVPGAPLLIGAGVEWLSGNAVPIRVGYAYDELTRTHYFTGGLGYIDQSVGIDLSIRQALSGENATYLMLGIRYFYDASGGSQTGVQQGL
ncbi:MAG: hypothetical protein IPK60_14335 [Sandaracinaceae bacterium]|jgi:hypothetical protein|nr:hypothetical protein [Sandaracinaceae bacterium]